MVRWSTRLPAVVGPDTDWTSAMSAVPAAAPLLQAAFASDGGAVNAPTSRTSVVARPTSRADTEFELTGVFLPRVRPAARRPPRHGSYASCTGPPIPEVRHTHAGGNARRHAEPGGAHATGAATSGQAQPRIEHGIEDVGE